MKAQQHAPHVLVKVALFHAGHEIRRFNQYVWSVALESQKEITESSHSCDNEVLRISYICPVKTVSMSMVILALSLLASAQTRPEIVDFTPEGTVSFTFDTNMYQSLEWKGNLSDSWLKLGSEFWSRLPTSTVSSYSLPILAFPSNSWSETLEGLGWFFPEVEGRFEGHYFRVVSTRKPGQFGVATNYVVVKNKTHGSISDFVFNVNPTRLSSCRVTNISALLPSESTPEFKAVAEHNWLIGLDMRDYVWPNVTNQAGWFAAWSQDGTNRVCGTGVVPLGDPSGKHVVNVTIYNDAFDVEHVWLGSKGTVRYDR